MSALARTVVVAEMQLRELLRRRAVMALLVLFPAAFYYSVPASEAWGMLSGSIGVSWAVAAAGVFAVLGWRRADPRLALAGAPAWQGLLGRLLLLHMLGLALVARSVPQARAGFGAYVRENILYGKPDATRPEVEAWTAAEIQPSASPIFWQVRPIAPRRICMWAMASVLCVLMWGRRRSALPANAIMRRTFSRTRSG